MINKIYFEKTNYTNLENVELIIKSGKAYSNCLIEIFEIDDKIKRLSIDLASGDNKVDLGFFDNKVAGYRIILYVENDIYTSVFSIDPKLEIIRYGFLSDFDKFDNNYDIEWMRDNHINYVQFYDWSYHHDNILSKEIVYKDSMGKLNNINVIKDKIKVCNEQGMYTMAYGPIYAATKEYYQKHKEEAYYATNKRVLSFIDTFYFMNISDNSKWKNHIINEYKKSINELGFDGIHLDTYGYPKRAYDYDGEVRDVEKDILSFLKTVSAKLQDNKLIFNNVGAWPLNREIGETQSAIYIEVWPPYETFYNLREIINKAKENYKAVIISAYISSFREDRKRALYSALFTTFYINSLGATHLFLGEEGCVITQGYYCDYSKLYEDEKKEIKKYQDFFVANQELLYDKTLVDVTMTHCGWDNQEYIIEGNYSLTAQKGCISLNIRANKNTHLISLMNLENNDEFWNLGKGEPSLSSTLNFKVEVFKKVENVYFMDPESINYLPIKLDFSCRRGERSDIIEFGVPPFKVGALVYIKESE